MFFLRNWFYLLVPLRMFLPEQLRIGLYPKEINHIMSYDEKMYKKYDIILYKRNYIIFFYIKMLNVIYLKHLFDMYLLKASTTRQ